MNKVKAKLKTRGYQTVTMSDPYVSGYLVIVNDRFFVYDKAKMNVYGTIKITDYVEIDPNTIEVIKDDKR